MSTHREQIVTALVIARLMMTHSNEALHHRDELEQMETEDLAKLLAQIDATIGNQLQIRLGPRTQ